ncbi:MAG: hypothetical protein HYY48_10860 [Gammaproteobacteria bacterium]|nr:hypothetical protein [Gammaproteobacteria bacterium]
MILLGTLNCAGAAEPLGRLFTSPQQRKQLDDLRDAIPEGEQIVAPEFRSVEPDASAVPEAASGSAITVKGLVRRGEGRSMAWINDSNTYEGDLASQYLRIDSNDIQSGGVRISVPDQERPINVKVGESYNPASGQVADLAAAEDGAAAAESPVPAVPQPAAGIPAPR